MKQSDRIAGAFVAVLFAHTFALLIPTCGEQEEKAPDPKHLMRVSPEGTSHFRMREGDPSTLTHGRPE